MVRTSLWAASFALAAMIGIGCGGEGEVVDDGTTTETGVVTAPPAEPPATPEGTDVDSGDAAEGDSAATDVTLSEDEIAQIEKLPAEDRALALAQKVCPASNEPLGSMGVPIKVKAGDDFVFVCCAGCVKEVEENPDEYLAKLGKK